MNVAFYCTYTVVVGKVPSGIYFESSQYVRSIRQNVEREIDVGGDHGGRSNSLTLMLTKT